MKSVIELKVSIIKKLDTSKPWGKLCNQIQDVAYDHLSAKAWNSYIEKAARDSEECDGSDFLVMNGRYWDWKEFDTKTVEIVTAFLDYFNASALTLIEKYL